MKLAIIGSREYHDFQTAVEVFGMTSRRYGVDQWDSIVSGGASGADFIGKKLATLNAIPYVEFPADWERYGKRAGVIRNKDIISIRILS